MTQFELLKILNEEGDWMLAREIKDRVRNSGTNVYYRLRRLHKYNLIAKKFSQEGLMYKSKTRI